MGEFFLCVVLFELKSAPEKILSRSEKNEGKLLTLRKDNVKIEHINFSIRKYYIINKLN